MEIDEGKKEIRSSYEVALDRFANKAVVTKQPRMDRGGLGPVVDERPGESTYDETMFVKNDHVSISKPSFTKNKKERVPEKSPDEPESLMDITAMPKLPAPKAEMMDVCCHWGGPMFDYGGYARMNRTFTMGLARRGALVRTRPIDSITNVNKPTEDYIRKLATVNVPNEYPRVFGQTVPDLIAHAGKKILFTMMETSNGIHPELAEKYNMADEIWVPCQWNVETFRASGVIPEIKVMPLGVDTSMFNPGVEPLNFNFGTRGFKFLSVFGWSYRKGFDVLIQAFLEEFSSKDDVSLILSSRFVGQKEKKERILSDFSYVRSLVAKDDVDLPHVTLHCDYTPDRDMPRLYRAGDCFVLPSRGEGFGLPFCFLPDTIVQRADGRIANIEEIHVGDKVVSLSHPSVNVIVPISHNYSGDILSVNPIGVPEVKCTPEHPFMAVKRGSRYDVGKDLTNRIVEIPAEELEKGDFLVTPIVSGTRESIDDICLEDYGIVESKFSNRGKSATNSWRSIAQDIGEHKSAVARAVRGDDHISDEVRARVLKKMNDRGIVYKHESYDTPTHLVVDDLLLEFFGLYIAEGSTNNSNSVFIASHVDEVDERDLAEDVIRSRFLREPSFNFRGKKCEMSFHMVNSKKLFGRLFGTGARNKHIPSMFMEAKPSVVRPLLRGIFNGDGHVAKEFISYSSSSVELVYQIRCILLGLGIRCAISKSRTRDSQYTLVIREDAEKFVAVIGIDGSNLDRSHLGPVRTHQWIVGGKLFTIVRDVKSVGEYNGKVYNLDTDADSTYLAGGVAVHNCEAGACGIPVIASDHGGQKDFLDDEVAYMVPPDDYYVSSRQDPPFKNMSWISHYYEDQEFPHFGRPAIDLLKSHMRHVFENYGDAMEKAKKLRKRLVEKFDWNHSVDRVYERLKEICDEL
jgi:glycosyltransferase involved in cell wall biosynthesis